MLRRHASAVGSRAECAQVDYWCGFGSRSLLARCRNILTGVDGLEHSRDLPPLGRRHMTEDVAVPMHDAALPSRLGKELSRTLGKAETSIRDDQPNAFEPPLFEVLEECATARLVLLGTLADTKYLSVSIVVDADRDQQRDIAHLTSPAALEHNAAEIHIRMLALDRPIAPSFDRSIDLLV